MIDFISAVNNEEQFEQNLKQSSVFTPTRFALQRGYTNVPRAYNEAAETSTADLLCFVHQDVFFPSYWLNNFWKAVDELERFDANWGVLGVAGVRMGRKREWYGNLRHRGRQWGGPEGLPASVQTLDELLLVRKNNDGLKFDEAIPTNHLYGADICLQAQRRGQKCYAIDAYCHHNSRTRRLPADFHPAADYLKTKWESCLPILTTCAILKKEVM